VGFKTLFVLVCYFFLEICFVTFSLERKSNQKVQGKSAGGRTGYHRSAGFSGLARGKSRWIDYKGRCSYFVMQAGNSIPGFVFLPLIAAIFLLRISLEWTSAMV
jgi:hypothetical protein